MPETTNARPYTAKEAEGRAEHFRLSAQVLSCSSQIWECFRDAATFRAYAELASEVERLTKENGELRAERAKIQSGIDAAPAGTNPGWIARHVMLRNLALGRENAKLGRRICGLKKANRKLRLSIAAASQVTDGSGS